MKKAVFTLLTLICVELSLTAQTFFEKAERRVYYLDVTASMTGYNKSQDIWESVVTNLKDAIRSIDNTNTEVVVKTFTDANHDIKKVVSTKATPNGKEEIMHCIDKLDPSKNINVHTDVYVPIEDFYEHEISPTKVNYFFLMTDGNQHQKGTDRLRNAIGSWNKKTGNGGKHIYGFYVMLCNAAHSQSIEQQIKQQQHLWTVKSANVNINLIRPKKDNFICNIRNNNKRYVDIPMAGEIKDVGLKVSGSNEYCQVGATEVIDDNTLRVSVSLKKKHLAQIPKLSTLELRISLQPTSPYTYLLADSVSIQCDNLTPWEKIGIFTGIGLLLLLLIWFLLIKPAKYCTFRTFNKQILVKQNGKIVCQKRLKFTGARRVVFSNKKVPQSFFNRLFTGEIITWVSPQFVQPITFRPTQNRKGAYVNGMGYVAMPNPIPRNGISTIKNEELQIEIILN